MLFCPSAEIEREKDVYHHERIGKQRVRRICRRMLGNTPLAVLVFCAVLGKFEEVAVKE